MSGDSIIGVARFSMICFDERPIIQDSTPSAVQGCERELSNFWVALISPGTSRTAFRRIAWLSAAQQTHPQDLFISLI
jgi:hypothetical protein